MTQQILIVAAEASSALYAQRLLEHWRRQGLDFHAFGIGSSDMEALGFERLGKSEELAVMGFVEVAKHFRKIKSVFNQLVVEAEKRRPQFVLLLDYPDFNLRLAKKMKALGIPVVYYISPQVWAWRKSRVHFIKKHVDKMLCLLPFEKDFYKQHGVDVEFVGHPMLDEIDPKLFDAKERDFSRSRYGVSSSDTWVGLMPGSRNAELEKHLAVQLEVAKRMHLQRPDLKFALLVAPSYTAEELKQRLPAYDIPLSFIKDDPMKMVSLVDIVLVASGTATLVVGLLQKPMVIMYKMSPLTVWIARKIVKGTRFFGLINLVLGKKVVPELLQDEASVENLTTEMMKYVNDIEYRKRVEQELAQAPHVLGDRGVTARVANYVQAYLQ